MTEKNDQRPDLKAVVSNAAIRFVEIYLGAERPIELPTTWRIMNAFAGSMTLLAFAFESKRIQLLKISWEKLEVVVIVQNIAGIVMMASPVLLALAIGFSIRKGGPLRFFFLGFFLYSVILSIAVM